jgi:cell division protein FtsQ
VVNRTRGPRARRRTRSGLPVQGALPPRTPRVQRRRHTGAWLALASLLLLIVGGTVVWRLQKSSLFVITQVQVTGAHDLDAGRVVQAAGVIGKPLYRVNIAAVQRAVAQLPLVQSDTVTTSWPHTVRIGIRERQPWGTWQSGGQNYLVDAQGKVLDIVSAPEPHTIYDLDATPGLQLGDQVDGDAIRLADQLIEELPATISQQVAKLEYSSEDGLDVITDRGVLARFGDSQGLDYKLAVWQAIDAKVGVDHVHQIDLRFGDRPVYR